MKNTYEKVTFIFENIYLSVLTGIWYKWMVFKSVSGFALEESKKIMYLTVAFSVILGCMLQMKDRRNKQSTYSNVLIGYGIYTSLAYYKVNPTMIKAIVFGVIAINAVYILILTRCAIKRNFLRSWNYIVCNCVRICQGSLALGMAVIMAFYGFRINIKNNIALTQNKGIVSSEYSISSCMDELALLDYEVWDLLSVDKKTSVLQIIANIERAQLGISHENNVCILNLDETTLGFYFDNLYIIAVDTESLINDSPWELVNTICHESFHSYEHCLIELYDDSDDKYRKLKFLSSAPAYKLEFYNYIDFDETKNNFEEYYNQKCETDAREYAEQRTQEYRLQIRNYLNNHEEF